MLGFLLVTTIALIAILLFLNRVYQESYWKKRGVPFCKNNGMLGPFWEYITTKRSMFEIFRDIYNEFPQDPAVGLGSFFSPSLYVKDPTNMQHVLSLDFNSFNHRGIEPLDGDLLSDNVLMQYGKRWKLVRQSMTSIFTSAKLKNMFYIVDKSAQDFIEYLNQHPEKQKANTFDTLSTFCAAAIGASVFGISTPSVFDNPFLTMAQKSFIPNFWNNIKFSIVSISPYLTKLLRIRIFSDYEKFFIGAISQVIEQRKLDNVKRHDFADLCISLQNSGTLRDQDTQYEVEPSVELLAAQAFFFFIAGVEPSATAAFGTLIELGRHPEHLKSVQDEIDAAFEKHNSQLSFDVVNSLEKLDNALSEAMRIHPPIGFLTRKCVQDTVLPVGNIKIDEGTKIFLPTFDVHHDPKYYPDPEVFNPDRFRSEANVNKDMYMPFGKGKRLCIGSRYAQLQVKTGLIYLLHNYDVKTHVGKGGLKYNKQTVQVRPHNVDVELIPRKGRKE